MAKRSLQSQLTWYSRAQWGMGGAALLVLLAMYFLGWRPLRQSVAQLRSSIDSESIELRSNQTNAKGLPEVLRQVAELRAKVEQFKKLPQEQDLPQFINDVTRASQQLSLRKLVWHPQAPRRTEMFSEMPVVFNFEGDFLSAVEFIRRTEDMPRLTRVRKLEMRSRDGAAGQVEVELSMNLYFGEGE